MNDANHLGGDPAMRRIVGGKAIERHAASTTRMERFQTELLATIRKAIDPARDLAKNGAQPLPAKPRLLLPRWDAAAFAAPVYRAS